MPSTVSYVCLQAISQLDITCIDVSSVIQVRTIYEKSDEYLSISTDITV